MCWGSAGWRGMANTPSALSSQPSIEPMSSCRPAAAVRASADLQEWGAARNDGEAHSALVEHSTFHIHAGNHITGNGGHGSHNISTSHPLRLIYDSFTDKIDATDFFFVAAQLAFIFIVYAYNFSPTWSGFNSGLHCATLPPFSHSMILVVLLSLVCVQKLPRYVQAYARDEGRVQKASSFFIRMHIRSGA